MSNPFRISAVATLRREGINPDDMDSILEFVQSAEWEGVSVACCTESCEVEPDGRCPHGCPSLASILLATIA